jgi:hypothetical protein
VGEYSDLVKANIASDNASLRILYMVLAALGIGTFFLFGGMEGPVVVLLFIAATIIHSRMNDRKRLDAAKLADGHLDPKLKNSS